MHMVLGFAFFLLCDLKALNVYHDRKQQQGGRRLFDGLCCISQASWEGYLANYKSIWSGTGKSNHCYGKVSSSSMAEPLGESSIWPLSARFTRRVQFSWSWNSFWRMFHRGLWLKLCSLSSVKSAMELQEPNIWSRSKQLHESWRGIHGATHSSSQCSH